MCDTPVCLHQRDFNKIYYFNNVWVIHVNLDNSPCIVSQSVVKLIGGVKFVMTP